jgi:phospholipid/cholesterol/gamma-HCH transport system permease protein
VTQARQRSSGSGWLARTGRLGIASYRFWRGAVLALVVAMVSWMMPGKAAGREVRAITVQQVFFTGVQGLWVITAAAVVTGATMVVQTAAAAPGMPGEILGQVLVAVVLRELAPLSTATIVASRSGTAIATELGNMRASHELHALSSLGIDAPRFVVFPRMVGVIVSVLALTIYFSVLAIGGALVGTWVLGTSVKAVQIGLANTLGVADLVLYLVKGVGCGVLVGWFCCHYGMQVRASSTEVPFFAGKAVVRSVLGCVVYNFLVTVGFYAIMGPPLRW